MAYGKELVVDLYGCDPKKFTRDGIEQFLIELCELIGMERCDLHFWDYVGYPEEKANAPIHLDGTTAVQFIKTSNITIHTLDKVGEVYLNLFSCKEFKPSVALEYIKNWFKAKAVESVCVLRGRLSKCETEIEDEGCMDCISHGKCSGPRYIIEPCEHRIGKESTT